ncbi:solute carrier family 22 member 13 [Tribolium castaneum]|uniref:Organic cation transporter protein-like Protein n=1 Tax=Tribolium castaneum TaxID=7070 RepID=D6WHS6_TRICA|nr:PREDICTED: organic cation transporter protein [Tribolium castaneum]EFA00687.1 Organic cation transporter protein-like Protein [Tribolium castaneum]|eukprot:XP_967323.2 PREDICTED: organic cation transporter protein [Tribolium castaneum]
MPPQEKMPETGSSQECESQLEMQCNGYTNGAFVPDNVKEEKKDEKDEKGFEFDDLLPRIGEFGMYQKILFLMMIPFSFFVAWVYFTQIFITIIPEQHWCWVPELANMTVDERIALAIPRDSDGSLEKCQMYDVNFEEVVRNKIPVNTSWPTTSCKNGWEYNYTEVPYSSIATEQNWVCENSALPHTAQSIFFCGAILGGLVFGWIADRFGRIPALVGTNLVGFVGGIATAFCSAFWTFCLCRFLVGMAFDNCFTMMYILVLEYVGPKWRTFVANMSIAIFFTFAASILPWIAYYLADWKMLCYVTSAPLVLAIVTPWLVPESARWLVSQGKFDKAIGILRKFQRINKTKVEEETYNKFKASCLKTQKEEEMDKAYTVLDLFKTPRLRKITLLLIVMWMAISLVFDGHVRNVGSLGLDIFLTFTIASATEFPADTFLTLVLDVWGRRWLACGSMVLSGIFSLLATTVPYGVPSAALAIMGRFAVNISYNIGLQYAAELLPTVVRAQGVALIHIMGYVASILAPFVVYLANISVDLPLLILGVLGIVGGILALFLPETLDQELPQTLQDGENFGMGQKIWDFPCAKKSVDDDKGGEFRRSSSRRSSLRASFRGEIRSSMINRSSIRSRKSICIPENQIA